MKALFIINAPRYDTERVYSVLRLAHALLKKELETEVTVFLMADSVVAAEAGQKTPDGYYNFERMLRVLAGNGRHCCAEPAWTPSLDDAALMAGAGRSTMDELAAAHAEAGKPLVF